MWLRDVPSSGVYDLAALVQQVETAVGRFDGVFDDVREARFGPAHVKALAARLTARLPQRSLDEIRFYTGVPAASIDQFRQSFWINECRHLRNQGVHVYTGRVNSARQEKGVDVSLALDLIQADPRAAN